MENKPYRSLLLSTEGELDASLAGLKALQDLCHGLNREAGWWDRNAEAAKAHELRTGAGASEYSNEMLELLDSVADKERNPYEMMSLIHSEVSEMLEGTRRDLMDDKLPHRKMEEVECADTLIRLLDFAGGRGLDLVGATLEKLRFNVNRADHKKENREKANGKKC